MSGFIAQALLGATGGAATGMGNKLREEAKLKRQQILEGTRTEEAMKQDENRSGLNREENEQRHGMTMEQQKSSNQDAINRIRLTDDLSQRRYIDVTDENGNVTGQREVGSNKLDKYSTSGGRDMTLTNRQKALAESLTNRIKAIDDSAEYGAVSPEDMERRDAMEVQLNALFAGSGQFSELMNGTGDGQGGSGGDTPGPDKPKKPDPESIGGLVGGAMKTGETQDRVKVATDQINGLQDEADDLMARLNPPTVTGAGGRPDGNNRPQVSQDDIAAAQDLVQRLLALENDPATAEALTPRLRNNIKQRIMDIQRAGVPLNLNQ